MLRVYAYKGCDTCRRALKFLDAKKIAYEAIPIREQPPTVKELERMLAVYGDLRKLFNTSGGDYKALDMKTKLPKMSNKDALLLLSKNGNLVKRPFALHASTGLVGFREDEWNKLVDTL